MLTGATTCPLLEKLNGASALAALANAIPNKVAFDIQLCMVKAFRLFSLDNLAAAWAAI
jgi:hypothetical protein